MAPDARSALLMFRKVGAMHKIQQIFDFAYHDFCLHFQPSDIQAKAAHAIMDCKSGKLGCNVDTCEECGHIQTHNNSCRNRSCPCCQAVLKELWIDARKAEVIDAPYFHLVFTVPAELNPLIYANQKLLYGLLHDCSARTVLSLSSDRKYLGGTPGIIQVLHSGGQELIFHPHIHAIVSGAGLSKAGQLVSCSPHFFIPESVLGSKFRGMFLDLLHQLYTAGKLMLPDSCSRLRNSYEWQEFRDSLYRKTWVPHAKETFNGFGNAIDYLGRYVHRIAISNSRILSVTKTETTFTARDYKTGERKTVTLTNTEFLRRFLMHVLPSGFHKIRYYGFLNNRDKRKNLKIIFKIQGKQMFRSLYSGMKAGELLLALWDINIRICPCCGCEGLRHTGRTYAMRN